MATTTTEIELTKGESASMIALNEKLQAAQKRHEEAMNNVLGWEKHIQAVQEELDAVTSEVVTRAGKDATKDYKLDPAAYIADRKSGKAKLIEETTLIKEVK